MNYNKIIKSALLASLVCIAGSFYSCAEDVEVGKADTTKFEDTEKVYGYVRTANAPGRNTIDLFNAADAKAQVKVGLTRNADFAVDVKLEVDGSVLEAYNKEHSTDFELFPVVLASIEGDGATVVPPGYKTAQPVDITVSSSEALEMGKTYALPIRITSVTEGVELDEAQRMHMFFVKYQGDRLDASKESGIKILSCMEVNDTNPLNNGEFFLKSSGKPLIDIVVLFSANININPETGRVYVNCNSNVRTLLENREKYIVPLQEQGMKVVLGILGNRDRSGVANLTKETAAYFAQELKSYCDAYDLDGIFWDDEYSSYVRSPNPGPGPGFVYPESKEAASRLLFESKKAMPDKLNIAYEWGLTRELVEVDGLEPGVYMDYAVANYKTNINQGNYPGTTRKQLMTQSMEFNQGSWVDPGTLTRIRTEGYGGTMIFAMDPNRGNWAGQLYHMQSIAQNIYEDELIFTGVKYPKDWE